MCNSITPVHLRGYRRPSARRGAGPDRDTPLVRRGRTAIRVALIEDQVHDRQHSRRGGPAAGGQPGAAKGMRSHLDLRLRPREPGSSSSSGTGKARATCSVVSPPRAPSVSAACASTAKRRDGTREDQGSRRRPGSSFVGVQLVIVPAVDEPPTAGSWPGPSARVRCGDGRVAPVAAGQGRRLLGVPSRGPGRASAAIANASWAASSASSDVAEEGRTGTPGRAPSRGRPARSVRRLHGDLDGRAPRRRARQQDAETLALNLVQVTLKTRSWPPTPAGVGEPDHRDPASCTPPP